MCESVCAENVRTPYLKTKKCKFTQLCYQMYLGLQTCWLDFGVKTLKVKVTARNDQKNPGEYNIFV